MKIAVKMGTSDEYNDEDFAFVCPFYLFQYVNHNKKELDAVPTKLALFYLKLF